MIMFEVTAHTFLIHEEVANTEGQCCIILLPDFCFRSLLFFYFCNTVIVEKHLLLSCVRVPLAM